jgi:preprotein translocase subunit SecA
LRVDGPYGLQRRRSDPAQHDHQEHRKRAQKKVEENNFGTRKRLLEYDDVMNKQRNVVYGKRNHALHGERLALDLDNSFYSVAEQTINLFKDAADYEGFKLAVIVNFGLETTITEDELKTAMQMCLPKNCTRKQS